MFKKSVAVADISNYAKNVTRCLIWEKTGTCDLKVDAKVTNQVNVCCKHVKGAKKKVNL